MLRLLLVASVLCFMLVRDASSPAAKGAAFVAGVVLLTGMILTGGGTRRERLTATALFGGAIASWAVADFAHVRAAIWGVVLCGAALAIPPFVTMITFAFRAVRNALRIRVLMQGGGADRPDVIDHLTRL